MEECSMVFTRLMPVVLVMAASLTAAPTVYAKEFKVDCTSAQDCMDKGDMLAKKRKLSLSLEAYRNAIKFDTANKDAWAKFERIVVRISEEGGC
jgi:hypothetical protein